MANSESVKGPGKKKLHLRPEVTFDDYAPTLNVANSQSSPFVIRNSPFIVMGTGFVANLVYLKDIDKNKIFLP